MRMQKSQKFIPCITEMINKLRLFGLDLWTK